MKCLFCTVLVILLAVVVAPSVFAQDFEIPSWIKNNAGWWADGQIDDGSFVSGMQWLITNGIMTIPPTEQGIGSDNVIPDWIKNNAGWWADGQIDDGSFVSGMQWLITNGIIMLEETRSITEFRVAFIGDQGFGPNSFSVLQLIKDEGTELVLHQGDLDYEDNPDKWDRMISNVLGDDFPYFVSVGHHDIMAWDEGPIWSGYRDKLYDRLEKNPEITCVGDLGVKSSCTYKELFFILVSPGSKGSDHDLFIENQLKNNNSIWSVCSWAFNMDDMQIGSQGDRTGWEVYNACKNGGAIIATGHEHSYHRTKTLIDIENQIIDPEWSDPNELRVKEGSTFVFVSGIGGHSIRDQDRCLPASYPYGCNQEWANIYTADQGANFGALFCDFNAGGNTNKAYCYFKNIDGEIIDEFNVTSFIESSPVTTNPAEVDSLTDYLSKTMPKAVDLSGVDLSGVDLSGVDLSGVDLSGKDLTYANLSGQDLSDHDLGNVILTGADLSNSILPDIGLSANNFDHAILDGVDLSGKDLSYSTFRYASFDNANLENVNLTGTKFFQVDLTNIKNKSLSYANLDRTSFAYSNLSGINLNGATLDQNNFNNANVSGVDFTVVNNKLIRGTVFGNAIMTNVDFEGIDFFDGIEYSDTYPGQAYRFDEIKLGVENQFVIEDGFLNKVVVSKKVVENDLVQTFVYNTSFNRANLQNANFSNANLIFSILYETDLTNANLSNVDLTGANLTGATLDGAILDGAILDHTNLDCKNHPVCNN